MDKVYYPEDFAREQVKGSDASQWTNAQVLEGLNWTVELLLGQEEIPEDSVAGKNYRKIVNEIRRRMQANVENYSMRVLERYYPVDKETGMIENDEDIPPKHDSVESAWASLETDADCDDDLVMIGISPEDYMRTWNRLIDRKHKRIFYYEDEEDPEHMRIGRDE